MLTGALSPLPLITWLTVNIIYNETVPYDYEPPLMESIKRQELPQFSESPLSIKIGELDTGYNNFVLKLRRPDEDEKAIKIPGTTSHTEDLNPECLAYDSDDVQREEKIQEDDDATVVSDDGVTFGRCDIIEETQIVSTGLTSDTNGINAKQKESLFQAFQDIVRKNPGVKPKILLDESELGSVLSATLKREFLGRIHTTKKKSKGVNRKKKTGRLRKPLESISNDEDFHMTQDTMQASQENMDPTERVSRGRRKIECIQPSTEDCRSKRLKSISCVR